MKFVITGVGAENSLGSKISNAIKQNIPEAYIIAICEPGLAPNCRVDQFFSCDLSDLNSTKALFDAISKTNPNIYAVINCAGMNYMSWFGSLDIFQYEKVMTVNATSVIQIIQSLLPSLKNGTVLNIISAGAQRPYKTSLPYNASKAALRMITLQLARELKYTHNIDVFGISPSQIAGTELTKTVPVGIVSSTLTLSRVFAVTFVTSMV